MGTRNYLAVISTVPTIKVSSSCAPYQRMKADMDIDAGGILFGRSVQEVGREILEEVVSVASGKSTKSESAGVGEEEFSPWGIGAVL